MIWSYIDWYLIVILLGVLLFSGVRVIFPKYLNSIWQGMFSRNSLNKLYLEKNYSWLHGAYRLNLLFNMMSALSLFLIYKEFTPELLNITEIYIFLIFFFAIILISKLRKLNFYLWGVSLNRLEDVKKSIFINSLLKKVGGIILLFGNIVAAYAIGSSRLYGYILLIVLIMLYIISFLSTFRYLFAKGVYFIYIFLYFCTLEILPITLGYFVVKDQIIIP